MASAAQRAPKRKRRPRDPSVPLSRPFERKGAQRKESGGSEEKRKRRKEEEKKKRKEQKKAQDERESGMNTEEEKGGEAGGTAASSSFLLSTAPIPQQLRFFLEQFESANKFKISSLELEAVKDTCIVKLAQGINQDVDNFCKHVKDTFGESWKEVLQEGKLLKGKVDAGRPALLIISISALRSLELLRIKKLIDMEALGLSRLSVIVLDMHKDAKGFSLFTLPQVRNEFWDLYKSHIHQRLVQGDLRICFYGPTSISESEKTQASDES
ncbi:hypothetical protein Taro_044404 [Colocasia esculenta]|uniref:Protein CMSS1 n=1 Tax=Colocasia esculenta TaxID=4460 RepID=A0A843X386_COLES|nr:hypothetical protein [Colocasia esculenta]